MTIQRQCTRFVSVVFLVGMILRAVEAVPGQDGTTAENFMHFVATALCREPETGEENVERVAETRSHQRKLLEWFHEHDMHVSEANCTTDVDRKNLEEFRTTMSTRDILACSRRDREEIYRALVGYARTLDRNMEGSLRRLCDGDPALFSYLKSRWDMPLTFREVYFGQAPGRGPAAVFMPQWQRCYLELNVASREIPRFLDSFEHELWHHLMPTVEAEDVGSFLWWEGFNECVSEAWSHICREAFANQPDAGRMPTYPVQTAFASLFWGWARMPTLRFLCGFTDHEAYVQALSKGIREPPLAELFASAGRLSATRRERVLDILQEWGQGSVAWESSVIPELCDGKGVLAGPAVSRLYSVNRSAVLAFLDAHAIVLLQDSFCHSSGRTFLRQSMECLPPELAQNLKRVYTYIHDPSFPLR